MKEDSATQDEKEWFYLQVMLRSWRICRRLVVSPLFSDSVLLSKQKERFLLCCFTGLEEEDGRFQEREYDVDFTGCK